MILLTNYHHYKSVLNLLNFGFLIAVLIVKIFYVINETEGKIGVFVACYN